MDAQTRVLYTHPTITSHSQFYLQITPCLPLLVSVHQMALPLICDGVHLIAAYYSSIKDKEDQEHVGGIT